MQLTYNNYTNKSHLLFQLSQLVTLQICCCIFGVGLVLVKQQFVFGFDLPSNVVSFALL